MRIIASGLRILEGQTHSFGMYLPVLIGIRRSLNELTLQNFTQCQPLIKALSDGFYERFKDFMNPHQAVALPLYIAMAVHPRYKLYYLGLGHIPPHTTNVIVDALYTECKKIVDAKNIETNAEMPITFDEIINQSPLNEDLSEFLIPMDVSSSITAISNTDRDTAILTEITQFLSSKPCNNKLEHLNKYPIIKQVFCKFNCIQTSEAICERLFSVAGKSICLFHNVRCVCHKCLPVLSK